MQTFLFSSLQEVKSTAATRQTPNANLITWLHSNVSLGKGQYHPLALHLTHRRSGIERKVPRAPREASNFILALPLASKTRSPRRIRPSHWAVSTQPEGFQEEHIGPATSCNHLIKSELNDATH